jgi:hypothetical protein
MPAPISEKVKGKQRAVESPLNTLPESTRDIVIRFTEGIPDLVLNVSQKDSVRDVKKHVCPYPSSTTS